MPRKPSPTLTDGEARLMNILWDRRRATVAEVVASLRGRPLLAYNTVLTMLRILERKGYVGHDKSGRAFVFRPRIGRRAAQRRAWRHLTARLFNDSPSLLVRSVLDDPRLGAHERERIREWTGNTVSEPDRQNDA